jgi:hypothetical protein
MKKLLALLGIATGLVLGVTALAAADAVGPITFEPPNYTAGDINGQNGWKNTGAYDSAVATVSSFPAAAGYGFGAQALRISSSKTSGSFGDQTFAPSLATAAGESTGSNHFDASFSVGTALATQQPGLELSVSPDDGSGGRMSYLRFEDRPDGVHVFFDDVTDPGPVGTVATFNETDIATLSRSAAHTVRFSETFVPGPNNDVVRIYIDGNLRLTGGSWEDYYRYDPEQNATGHVVPQTRTLIFREGSWAAASGTAGNGFLIDGVTMASSNNSAPTTTALCKNGGWKTFTSPKFKNQGQCIKASHQQAKADAGKTNHGKSDSNSKGRGNSK